MTRKRGLRLRKRRRSVRSNVRKTKRTGSDAENGRTRDVRSANAYVKNSGNLTNRENENATSDMNVDDEKSARDIGIGNETVNVIAAGLETGIGIGAGRGVGAGISGTGTGTVKRTAVLGVTVHPIALNVLRRLVLVIRSQNKPRRLKAQLLHLRNHPWTKSLSKRPH